MASGIMEESNKMITVVDLKQDIVSMVATKSQNVKYGRLLFYTFVGGTFTATILALLSPSQLFLPGTCWYPYCKCKPPRRFDEHYTYTMEEVTLEHIQKATEVIYSSPDIIQTPLACHVQERFPALDRSFDLYLKLENMQSTGSFKIRGVLNQMNHLPPAVKAGAKLPVTLSAGNYGKAFAYCLKKQGLSGVVVLPHSAPDDRVKLIQSYGVQAEKVPSHQIQERVDEYVEKGYFLFHPHEDANLIAAYGSIGMEILRVVPDPDVVVASCGGGALIAGVAAAIKLSPGGSKCRVYAVEPTGAPTMFESFKAGHAVKMPTARSIATGLMPPFAGKLPYELCKKYVEDVILVSDEEMVDCVRTLYYAGLVVEPAGSAALTALLTNRIPDISEKKVVVVISGGNISPHDLAQLIS